MKKILGLSVAAMMIMALVGGGTWAYFSDTETVTANTFTAGTLALSTNTATLHAAVSDVVPGMGEPGDPRIGTVIMTKVGSLTGELDVRMNTVTDTADGGATEWENSNADLGGEMLVTLYIDDDQSGAWNLGDIGLGSDGNTYAFDDVTAISATSEASASTTVLTDADHGATADTLIGMMLQLTVAGEARLITGNTTGTITVTDPFSANIGTVAYTVETLKWDTINNYDGDSWDDVYEAGTITSPANFKAAWRVPTSVGNDIQGDAVSFSIDLVVEQASAD
jgi:predicted ribosomally synthesized peptide with SipW-like signal peptide